MIHQNWKKISSLFKKKIDDFDGHYEAEWEQYLDQHGILNPQGKYFMDNLESFWNTQQPKVLVCEVYKNYHNFYLIPLDLAEKALILGSFP